METQAPVKNQQLQLKSVYTLVLDETPADEKNPSVPIYNLAKNGIKSICPYVTSVSEGGAFPCGTFCQFFNLVPQKTKKTEKVMEGGVAVEKEVVTETGKLLVQLSCGSGLQLPIANIDLKANSPLSVAK